MHCIAFVLLALVACVRSIHNNCPSNNASLVCSGHGVCFFICFCNSGFQGSDCSEELTCATAVPLLCTAQNWTCGGIDCDDADVCGGLGTCVAEDECACCPGTNSTGDNCKDQHAHCIPGCEHGLCLFVGDITSNETFCQCEVGFGGATCDDPLQCGDYQVADVRACSGHGTCTLYLGSILAGEPSPHMLEHDHPNSTSVHYTGDKALCCCDDGFEGPLCAKKSRATLIAISIVLGVSLSILSCIGLVLLVWALLARTRPLLDRDGDVEPFSNLEMQ